MTAETATDEHPSSTSPPPVPAGSGEREIAGPSLSAGDAAALTSLDRAGRWIARGGPALGLIAGTRTLVTELQSGGAGRGSWIVGLLDGAFLAVTWALAGISVGALLRVFGRWIRCQLIQGAHAPSAAAGTVTTQTAHPARRLADATAPTALEQLREETFAEIRRAIRAREWDGARDKLEALSEDHPDDPRVATLHRELATARETARDEYLSQLEAARSVNDPDRVLELHQLLIPLLEPEARAGLEAELSGWFLRLVHNRLRTGRIQAEVVQLAGRIADAFSHTPEGASLRASLPTLRRSVGLCPRCTQPYTGVADACPACMAQSHSLPRPPGPNSSLGGDALANGGT